MRRLILALGLISLALAKPELYKESEDFQFSRSSSDEGTKSGFYGAQRGNMGGNYEKAHNMDSLAQNQMSSLVKQVDGDLGEATQSRTGNVFTAANSRGMYGSGSYDLSNLQGRNFQEGTSLHNSESSSRSHSSLSSHNSAYGGHAASSYQNAGLNNYNTNSNYRNGYRTADLSQQYPQNSFSNAESLNNYDTSGFHGHNSQSSGFNSGYRSNSGHHSHSSYDQDQAQTQGSNMRTTFVSGMPVRVVLRPGSTVNVPVAAQTYDASRGYSSINKNSATAQTYDATKSYSSGYNSINSDADVGRLTSQANYQPVKGSNSGHHSQSSYDQDHSQIQGSNMRTTFVSGMPVRVVLRPGSTVNIPVAAQTYDASQGYSSLNKNSATAQTYDATKSYSGGYNSINSEADVGRQTPQANYQPVNGYTNSPKHYESSYRYHKQWEKHDTKPVAVPLGTPSDIPKNSELYEDSQDLQSSAHQNVATQSESLSQAHNSHNSYNSNTNTKSLSSYGTGQSYSGVRSNDYTNIAHNADSVANLAALNAISGQPKSYQSSYSYHKSWERQGDPYVIKPASGNYYGHPEKIIDGANTQSHEYSSHYKQTHKSYVQGSEYDINCDDDSHSRKARSAPQYSGQQVQSNWDYFNPQEQQNPLAHLENFGQQTQDNFDDLQQSQQQFGKLEDFGQHTKPLDDSFQQSQNQWDNFNSRQQTQDQFSNQQSQHQFDKLEDLGQQTKPIEDLVQQSQNNWDNFNSEQQQNPLDRLENFGQQTQGQFNNEQSQQQFDKLEDLGQQTKPIEDLVQQSQNNWNNFNTQQQQNPVNQLENFAQQTQAQLSNEQSQQQFDKLEDLGQQTKPIEDLVQQSQNNWDNFGQQTQAQFSNNQQSTQQYGTAPQQTDNTYTNLESFGQHDHTLLNNFDSQGQQAEHKFYNAENLSNFQQKAERNQDNQSSLQTHSNRDKYVNFGQHSQNNWDLYTNQQTESNFSHTNNNMHDSSKFNMHDAGNTFESNQHTSFTDNLRNTYESNKHDGWHQYQNENRQLHSATNKTIHKNIQSLWDKIDNIEKTSLTKKDSTEEFDYSYPIESSFINNHRQVDLNTEKNNVNNSTTQHSITIGRGDIEEPEELTSNTHNKFEGITIFNNKSTTLPFKTVEEIESLSLTKVNQTGSNQIDKALRQGTEANSNNLNTVSSDGQNISKERNQLSNINSIASSSNQATDITFPHELQHDEYKRNKNILNNVNNQQQFPGQHSLYQGQFDNLGQQVFQQQDLENFELQSHRHDNLANLGQATFDQKEFENLANQMQNHKDYDNVAQQTFDKQEFTNLGQQVQDQQEFANLGQHTYNQQEFVDLGQQTQSQMGFIYNEQQAQDQNEFTNLGQQTYNQKDFANFGSNTKDKDYTNLGQQDHVDMIYSRPQHLGHQFANAETQKELGTWNQESQSVWDKPNLHQSNVQPLDQLRSPSNHEKVAQTYQEERSIHKEEKKNEPQVQSVPGTVVVTEKPGFWKSVGNKFSNAKESVVSWFKS